MSVVIETTLGDITVDLFLKERPNTCLNFLKLCKVKYYNFCVFYKVERNFIAQTGDPTCTGRGGESIFTRIYGDQATYFEAELKPRLKHEKLGTLSMVNNGNNMNGSQFFITLGENLTYLDEDHTVFGEVAEGFETLLKINEAICDPNSRPYQDILITHTVILHDPYDDPSGLEIPDASPLPTKEQLDSNYIRADEEIDDTKGKSAEEIEERIKESEAKARATILEMVGDIPDADVKPPETVLFVCKLNPVTTSEDLEIIFSRFGVIKSCEVIKDKKTGESLQYAFIEFEKEEDCENAYFKMDNVLIDDRRIHVDFSQSVSKMMWEKGGKFPKNKNSRETFVLKNKEKKQDGYQMIFDMDDEITHSKHREKSKISPDRKYKRKNSPSQRSNERSRRRSRSADRMGEYTYREKEYNRSKSTRDNTHKTSKDYSRSSPLETYKNTSFSRQKQTKYNSRNHSDSSDESSTKNSKTGKSRYNKPRHDSSSDRSISPPRKQKSTVDKVSSSKYTHSTEKYHSHKSQKYESTVSYKRQDKKSVSSRHKSSSPDSDAPRNKSKIKSHSRSPEFSSRRTSKPKRSVSPEESKSHHREKKQASRKQSRSPESYNYGHSSKQIKKSHRNHSGSSNSRSPDRKKQLYRSRSRSVSPKNHACDSKLKSSYTLHEKTSRHSKKSKKNKKRTKSSSSCDSDSSSSSVPKMKHKDNSSHSKIHKSSHKEYKQRR